MLSRFVAVALLIPLAVLAEEKPKRHVMRIRVGIQDADTDGRPLVGAGAAFHVTKRLALAANLSLSPGEAGGYTYTFLARWVFRHGRVFRPYVDAGMGISSVGLFWNERVAYPIGLGVRYRKGNWGWLIDARGIALDSDFGMGGTGEHSVGVCRFF